MMDAWVEQVFHFPGAGVSRNVSRLKRMNQMRMIASESIRPSRRRTWIIVPISDRAAQLLSIYQKLAGQKSELRNGLWIIIPATEQSKHMQMKLGNRASSPVNVCSENYTNDTQYNRNRIREKEEGERVTHHSERSNNMQMRSPIHRDFIFKTSKTRLKIIFIEWFPCSNRRTAIRQNEGSCLAKSQSKSPQTSRTIHSPLLSLPSPWQINKQTYAT